MKGIEYVDSFNVNLQKLMLIVFDCGILWLKDATKFTETYRVNPLYLRHGNEHKIPDYRHWVIPLGQRIRSFKIWFTLRLHGVSGIQKHIRHHVKCAQIFEELLRSDKHFEIKAPVMLGVVCFRLIGSDKLNATLNENINEEKQFHITPCFLDGHLTLRYSVGAGTEEKDVKKAYNIIRKHASLLKYRF